MSALIELARRLPAQRVLVIGDVMLDHFVIGRVDRISPEAPVPVVRFDREEYRLGGAANVAHNIRAIGADAAVVGLVGGDEPAARLRADLRAAGIDDRGLIASADRPTTRKVRVVTTRNQQVARIDYERDGAPPETAQAQLGACIADGAARSNALVLSDYRKGVVSPDTIQAAVATARSARVPLLVDPKIPHAERYRGATLITPNHHEAELMTGLQIRGVDEAQLAGRQIHERCGASVLITLGEQGMWLLDASTRAPIEEALPATAREVSDVTGAGDTVIALLALSLAAGGSLADAARLANIAAGLVVARFGPAVVTLDELTAALDAPAR